MINDDLQRSQSTMHQIDIDRPKVSDDGNKHNQSQSELISSTQDLSSITNDTTIELSHQQVTPISTNNDRRCSNSSTTTSNSSGVQAIPDDESSYTLQTQSDQQAVIDHPVSHDTLPSINSSTQSNDSCPINQLQTEDHDKTVTSDDCNIEVLQDIANNQSLDPQDEQAMQDDSNLHSKHNDSKDLNDDRDVNKGIPFLIYCTFCNLSNVNSCLR